jgi:hypothetical protein
MADYIEHKISVRRSVVGLSLSCAGFWLILSALVWEPGSKDLTLSAQRSFVSACTPSEITV